MSRPRSFDHEEAARRFAAGETITDLMRAYGVKYTSMRRAVDPEYRRIKDADTLKRRRDDRRPCKGGCGTLVWTNGHQPRSGLCLKCYGLSVRTAEHGTESKYSQGCRCEACRAAARIAKRRRREKTRVPCSHGCGRMVDSINRHTPEKPPECPPCSNARIHGKLPA